MKLFSAVGGTGRSHPFHNLVTTVVQVDHPDDLNSPGVLVVWGGGDISPSYYGQRPGKYTGANDRPSRHDIMEADLILDAIQKKIPIVGICRGAQLACALAGGKLIQHVERHGGSHLIDTIDGRSLVTSSIHHQMMFPWDIEHQLLAWCEARSAVHLGEDDKEVEFPKQAYKEGQLIEPEIVWFPQIKTLAIQGHPEFMGIREPFVQYSLEQVSRLCL